MKNLHAITPNPTIWAWFNLYNRWGNRPLHNGTEHLFEISRGTPPPTGQSRHWWGPYTTDGDPFKPLCGYRTRANNPMTARAYGINRCANCEQAATDRMVTPTTYNEAIRRDPWNQIDRNARTTTTDPVSGV